MNDDVIADLQSHLESEIEDYLCYRGRNWSPEACYFVLDALKDVCRTWQANLEDAESEEADET